MNIPIRIMDRLSIDDKKLHLINNGSIIKSFDTKKALWCWINDTNSNINTLRKYEVIQDSSLYCT